MNCQSIKQRIWLAEFLLLAVTASLGYAKTNQDAIAAFEQEREAALRARFENDIRMQGGKVSATEKEVLYKKYRSAVMTKIEKDKGIIENDNKPIMIRGQVVDQDGLPVTNARISGVVTEKYLVGVNFYRIQTNDRDLFAQTDVFGNFTLDGGTGCSIRVNEILAPGYQVITEQQSATVFSPVDEGAALKTGVQQGVNSQAVVRLWKQQGQLDKLIVNDSFVRVAQDGKKHTFNVFWPFGYEDRWLPPVDSEKKFRRRRYSFLVGRKRGRWSLSSSS